MMYKIVKDFFKLVNFVFISNKLVKKSNNYVVTYLPFFKPIIIIWAKDYHRIKIAKKNPSEFISEIYNILIEDKYQNLNIWDKPKAPLYKNDKFGFIFIDEKVEEYCKALIKNNKINIFKY